MSTTSPEHSWIEFFDATNDREPREMVLKALTFVGNTGSALDLGCGCGCDTLAMLEHGLDVTALDAHDEAIRRTTARVQKLGLADRLLTHVQPFEDFRFDAYDLVNAAYSLPFCLPAAFEGLWSRIRNGLRPGGIFCGQFFGDRDQWAHEEGHRAALFFTRPQVENLIDGLERLHFEEHEEDGTTATGRTKHWHLFHLILRRPAT